jgi:hypothetical protein
MAITQERMIATLSALRRAYDSYSFLKKQILLTCTSLTSTSTLDDFREALQAIQTITNSPILSEDDFARLIAEEQHFRAAYRKNQRTAEYARRKRKNLPSTLGFSKGKAPSTITHDISDADKEMHYEMAEKSVTIGYTAPDRFPELDGRKASTSPHSMAKQKPLDLLTTKKPQRSTSELSIDQMRQNGMLSKLAADKLKLDAARQAMKMPAIYSDFSDDSIPLTLDDQIALGYVDPSALDEGVFQ